VPASEPGEQLSNGQWNLLDTLQHPNVVSVAASEQRAHAASAANVPSPALDLALTVGATNSLERMLCHQLAGVHHAAMELLVRVVQFTNLPPGEHVRLTNGAARLIEVYRPAV
jgi:hypothetical protein